MVDYTFHTPWPLKAAFLLMAIVMIAMAVGLFREGTRSSNTKDRVLCYGLGAFLLVTFPICLMPLVYFW